VVKNKRCKVCRTEFIPFLSMQKVCSPNCGITLHRIEKDKEFNAETRRLKKAVSENDVSLWRDKAQKMFNAFIRERDKNECCISCDKPSTWRGGIWAAGHYKTIGARPDLRFNEDNVNKQCNVDCNQKKSGNVLAYRKKLISKIGLERVEFLERDDCEPVRYRLEDYKEIYRVYRDKLKAIKKCE
jgi:Bacteriophage Lambda NinG protein